MNNINNHKLFIVFKDEYDSLLNIKNGMFTIKVIYINGEYTIFKCMNCSIYYFYENNDYSKYNESGNCFF